MKWTALASFSAIVALSGAALADGVLQTDAKALSGVMDLGFVEHDVTVYVDVVRYGNGTSHKAYIVNQFSGGTPTSVFPTGLSGVKITNCAFIDKDGGRIGKSFKINYNEDSNAAINGATGWAGSAPRIKCDAKKGNGNQPPENLDEFILR